MKILFVQPCAGFMMRGTTYPVCRSMMVTATYMKSLGHEVVVHDRCIDFRKAKEVANGFLPEIVMIYVPPTASLKDTIEYSQVARAIKAKVIWCEVVAAAIAEKVVENKYADFVITGETETKLRQLLDTLNGNGKLENISGLTFLEDDHAVTTPNRNDAPIETLPSIDWELINVKKCFRQFPHCKKMLYMYTSRGCPFKCTYCYNTMFYNSQRRKRSVSYVLDEIKYLEKTYGLDGVNFSDELLIFNDEEIRQIADFRKENGLNFYWGGETRTDIYSDIKTLKNMYDAGCRWFLLGIETGSNATRERIKKPQDKEVICRFIDMCTQVGISTFGSFIIGFPDETPEELKETAEFALSLNLDAFLFNYYVAIPKTPLGDDLIRRGILDVDSILGSAPSHQIQTLTKNYSKIPGKDLLVVKSFFDWMTFTRKKKESKQKSMFISKAFDTLKHFADGGILSVAKNMYDAGKSFVTIVYHATFFGKIKKKYGLFNINKQ